LIKLKIEKLKKKKKKEKKEKKKKKKEKKRKKIKHLIQHCTHPMFFHYLTKVVLKGDTKNIDNYFQY